MVKVTGVDHTAQTERLPAAGPVRISACLDVCDQANVIVAQPSAEGRAAGARPVGLGLVDDPAATVRHASTGTPGCSCSGSRAGSRGPGARVHPSTGLLVSAQ
ncbi:hypothetical protein [Streptomyces coeruleorubidus]|uniref:hypothetical protein n=1 Tax=Streptomyces coeruleorubidus TaxID=116188 RepID=UPI003F530A34